MNERIMRDDRLVGLGPNTPFSDDPIFDDTVKITDANGVWLFNTNSLVWAFLEFKRDMEGLSNELSPDRVPLYKLSPIDDKLSVCSGAPGLVYRCRQAELVLTLDEVYRMVMGALTAREYFTIFEVVGEAYLYWIIDHFYDSETGEALQPGAEVPIEITDANSVRSLDRNGFNAAFNQSLRDELSPMDDNPSLLSGAPGVLCRFPEGELVLTPDEAYRLSMRELTPEEYFKIYAVVGEIFETHSDFYDPETGKVRPEEEW